MGLGMAGASAVGVPVDMGASLDGVSVDGVSVDGRAVKVLTSEEYPFDGASGSIISSVGVAVCVEVADNEKPGIKPWLNISK